MTPLQHILEKLPDAKRNGQGWRACCPAHDDHNPSLDLQEGDDGRVLLICRAGCRTQDVVAAMGMTMADLFPHNGRSVAKTHAPATKIEVSSTPSAKKHKNLFPTAQQAVADLESRYGKKRTTHWVYTDCQGKPVGVVVRFDAPGGKVIQPVSKTDEGWANVGMSAPRYLYNLPDLVKAQTVVVVEGEKCAEAARSLGFAATTSSGGANSAGRSDWSPLAGKGIILLPDNNDAGSNYAKQVIELLSVLSPTPTIKAVELPDLPEGGDIVDFLDAYDGDRDAAKAKIDALVEQTQSVPLEQPVLPIMPYRAFPTYLLPEPIRGYVEAGAAAIGCDHAFIALPLLAALGAAIGNSRRVRLKRTWVEPPIIWSVIIGESGTAKSPAIDLAMRIVHRKQGEAFERHKEALKQFEFEKIKYDVALKDWKNSKNRGDPPQKPDEPVADRYWSDDATLEALLAQLEKSERGLLMKRDELAGLFGSFDRYSTNKGGDAARYLELFHGRQVIVDRKTTGLIHVPMASLCITGGIQPTVLWRTLGYEHRDNGLAARFLMAYPPRQPKRWSERDVPSELEAKLEGTFNYLYSFEPVNDDDNFLPVEICLTQDAKAAWIDFVNEHNEQQLQHSGDVAYAWSKLEGYAARFALIIHCTRMAASDTSLVKRNQIDVTSVKAAINLSRWFGFEMQRTYAMLDVDDNERELFDLVDLIHRLGGTVTPRELSRHSRRYQPASQAEETLDRLVKRGYARWELLKPSAKGGRPTKRIILHPYADTTDDNETEGEDGTVSTTAAADSDWGMV